MARLSTLLLALVFSVTTAVQASAATVQYDIELFAGNGVATGGTGIVELDGDVIAAGIASGTLFINSAVIGGAITAGGILFDTLATGSSTTVGAPGGVVSGLTNVTFNSSTTAGASVTFATSGGNPIWYIFNSSGGSEQVGNSSNPGYALTLSDVAPVPVPASLPLLLLGMGAFGIARRRKALAA